MEDVVFGLSYYQLIGIILSNVFPIELGILIARFLKLSDFENSRESYLEDYLRYDTIGRPPKKKVKKPSFQLPSPKLFLVALVLFVVGYGSTWINDFINSGEKAGKEDIGFIAQEFEKHLLKIEGHQFDVSSLHLHGQWFGHA